MYNLTIDLNILWLDICLHNVWYMFKNTRVIQISVFFLNIENIIKIDKIAMDGGWWMVDDGWCKIIKLYIRLSYI